MESGVQVMKRKRLSWWQMALLTIVVTALGGLSHRRSKKKVYTTQLKQAPWAPPTWVFPSAWTFNNYFLLQALQHLLRTKGSKKKQLLRLQLFIWVIFFSFDYIYFNKKSTVLAILWTASDTALALASFAIALQWNKKLAWRYLPLLGWTGFASTLASYQALHNPDKLMKIPKLLNGV